MVGVKGAGSPTENISFFQNNPHVSHAEVASFVNELPLVRKARLARWLLPFSVVEVVFALGLPLVALYWSELQWLGLLIHGSFVALIGILALLL
jgi:hypothetical protein